MSTNSAGATRFKSMVGKSCQQREGIPIEIFGWPTWQANRHIIINEAAAGIYRAYRAFSPEFSRPPVLDKVRPAKFVFFVGASAV